MFSERAKQLEKTISQVFGKRTSLAITNARIGTHGYFTRIESYGLPFKVDGYEDTLDESENIALERFEKEFEEFRKEDKLFPSQPLECYENLVLTDEQLNRLYQFTDLDFDPELLEETKNGTTAMICRLPNKMYECVINTNYMNVHARGTGPLERFAIRNAISVACEIIYPSIKKVGNWPPKEH